MCGITGIVDFKGEYKEDALDVVKRMNDQLRHRGPDDEGIFRDNKIALGHRRLSILDLSAAGNQPMSNKAQTLWITYNGEIYNYIEIRKELIAVGKRFITNTDTEVVLQAYEHWGQDCLSRFNGMWAFVIYDKVKNCLFASRDRFGVKPFYYFHNQDLFLFASEHKALLKSKVIPSKINNKAAFDYLIAGKLEEREESIFHSIYELMPSHAFTLDVSSGCIKKWKYYTLSYTNEWKPYNELKAEKSATEISNLLSQAVFLRLRSDVEVGACLSGGLDSSALVAWMNNLKKQKFKTFTAGSTDNHLDETHWAKIMANDVKSEWHTVTPTANDLLVNLEKIVYQQDIPFLTTSSFAQFSVMKLIKQNGIKVTLDGQGGDELFAGYDLHLLSYWMELIRMKKFQLLLQEFQVSRSSLVTFQTLKFQLLKYLLFKYAPKEFLEYVLKQQVENTFFNKDFWMAHKEQIHLSTLNDQASLNDQLVEHLTGIHLKYMLRNTDRNSMYHSVESRLPFADDLPLIEYVFQQPSSFKIHHKQMKHLLRLSLKGIVPEAIRMRKDKLGFATDQSEWIKKIQHELRAYLTNDLGDYFDLKKLNSYWDKYVKDTTTAVHPKIWRVINFAVWKKVYKL